MDIRFLDEETYEVRGIAVDGLTETHFCVFDLEGTGINFNTEHITQIGAVTLTSELEAERSFSTLVYSPKAVPPFISAMTGINDELLRNAPSFQEAYQQFEAFSANTVLVTQAGYEYDVPLLRNHCRQYGTPMLTNPILDIKALFVCIHPEITNIISTDFLIRYYDLPHRDLQRHDASGDCMLIARIFKAIMQEYRDREIDAIDWREGITVRRFQIPGMVLT
ncbi:PolC-type DNA polymerase III [Paenibacillus aurantiacus]|uniref:PolC-type DNA polymerase III n=1 Tax=Paenibacillus aurantiacus TaxID=1936118 RepID=A0ABV5KV70_9BACL